MTMAIDNKQLSDAMVPGVKGGTPTDRQSEALDRARAITRRSQALLAAAGEEAPDMAWIVARVASRADNAVEKVLTDSGIDCWVPVVKVAHVYRGGRRKHGPAMVEKPVWPGYLFVRTVMSARAWAGLFTVDGLVGLLGDEHRPFTVKPAKIKELRTYLASDRKVADRVANVLKAGDHVIVNGGPFASFPGVAVADEKDGQALIEMMIFGRPCRTQLDLAQIRKLA